MGADDDSGGVPGASDGGEGGEVFIGSDQDSGSETGESGGSDGSYDDDDMEDDDDDDADDGEDSDAGAPFRGERLSVSTPCDGDECPLCLFCGGACCGADTDMSEGEIDEMLDQLAGLRSRVYVAGTHMCSSSRSSNRAHQIRHKAIILIRCHPLLLCFVSGTPSNALSPPRTWREDRLLQPSRELWRCPSSATRQASLSLWKRSLMGRRMETMGATIQRTAPVATAVVEAVMMRMLAARTAL